MRRLALFAFALAMIWPSIAFAASRIVTPARDIARGETIAASDLRLASVTGMVQPGAATQIADIAGMQARRRLYAGKGVRLSDVRPQILVEKGTIVTMSFDVPGISLSASMRATSSGGLGETVTVVNPQSYRQVGAVVTGPGTVKALNSNPGQIDR